MFEFENSGKTEVAGDARLPLRGTSLKQRWEKVAPRGGIWVLICQDDVIQPSL
jgi:hypothetical protein